MKAIWLKTRERRRREEQEQRDSWTLWSKDFEERNDVMKVGREYWPAGWCLQKGRPSAIAISLEGSVEKYKAFIITLLVSFRFTGRRPPQLMSPWVMMMLMRWYLSPPCYFHWEAYLRNYAYFGTPYSSAYILESTRRGGRLVPFGSVLFNTLSNISENILTYIFANTTKDALSLLKKGRRRTWKRGKKFHFISKTQQAHLFEIGWWSALS